MNNELWASIERKLKGHNEAVRNLPLYCYTCRETLSPYDTGVDPLTNVRVWATECCGHRHYYEEKLGGHELLNDSQGLSGGL